MQHPVYLSVFHELLEVEVEDGDELGLVGEGDALRQPEVDPGQLFDLAALLPHLGVEEGVDLGGRAEVELL